MHEVETRLWRPSTTPSAPHMLPGAGRGFWHNVGLYLPLRLILPYLKVRLESVIDMSPHLAHILISPSILYHGDKVFHHLPGLLLDQVIP